MMAAGMSVKAEENEQAPIPVEEQAELQVDEAVTEDINEETIEQIDTTSEESSLSSDLTKNEVNNGIPVIYLNIDESKGTIDAMNSDPKHNTYCYGTMDFKLPSPDFQFVDLNTDLKEYENLDMSIKGR